ncbi:MAG: universal stress protein [Deltaproteobacteria bacterium]|jgi:nucleotide-binding universal stress UspA family protein|nr:universal stress protein [Deltaproteobacteria bacterium]MBW2504207.1 universal stress protein [Deltaproteobacteria bacterium]MBW2520529.1 universal stress protein [Deltaproteobacteria bacterium]
MAEITFKNILYATDFSESSVPACDYAMTLAKLSGAELFVLHVIGELSDSRRSLMPPQSLAELEKELELHAIKQIEQFCSERFGEQVPYQTETVIGLPFQEILAFAAQIKADLIVMGTHGRTGIEKVLVGSTAERVVRRSTVPVLTVQSSRQ